MDRNHELAKQQSSDLTALLHRWGDGDREAASEVMAAAYHELHSMAAQALRNERPGHTLQSTALVHEAYLRMVRMSSVRWQSRPQFFAIAAQVLRHILVDYARERRALKRGAGAARVSLDEALSIPDASGFDLEALDLALIRLAGKDPRKARVVELRYFGGLSVEEIAEVMNCSPMTVKRDWSFAKAWLYRDLAR